MKSIFQKIWPLLIGLVLFVTVSSVVRSHLDALAPFLHGEGKAWGMSLYVLIGIATVAIPFGSLLPFIPVAVHLWGWATAGLLTALSWVLGGQILFLLARGLGRNFIKRMIPSSQLESIGKIVHGGGFLHAVAMRMLVHSDIVSYGFGLFTDIGSVEFCFITIVGVTPAAFVYAYFGNMPLLYQALLSALAICIVALYWIIDAKAPDTFRPLTEMGVRISEWCAEKGVRWKERARRRAGK